MSPGGMQECFPSVQGDADSQRCSRAGLGLSCSADGKLSCASSCPSDRVPACPAPLRCHLCCHQWGGPRAGLVAALSVGGEWCSGRRPPPGVAGQPVAVLGNGPGMAALSPAGGADTWGPARGVTDGGRGLTHRPRPALSPAACHLRDMATAPRCQGGGTDKHTHGMSPGDERGVTGGVVGEWRGAAAPPRGAGRALLSPRRRCHSGATCARPLTPFA